MPTCPRCDAVVPEGAVYCGNCGATLNSPTVSTSLIAQSQTSQPSDWSNNPNMASGDMQARYEKAIKRTEQLSYAAAGLGVVILVVLLALSFL
jgi:hypothetical protein